MQFSRNLVAAALIGLLILGVTPKVFAQTGTAPPPPAPTYQAPQHSEAGAFAKGSKRVNVVGGAGSNLGQTYLIIGAGISYYLADGLALGLSGEGWILQDPTFWKISPDLRYTFWKMDKFKPYVGAFYRHTFVGDPFEDYDSWGGRAGVAYRQGSSYVSLGVVHEMYLGDKYSGTDSSNTYPELSFWFSF